MAAAVTQRVRIVPTLYVLPMRDAVAAAPEIATLDALADPGRAEVCLGVGGREVDYRAIERASRSAILVRRAKRRRTSQMGCSSAQPLAEETLRRAYLPTR